MAELKTYDADWLLEQWARWARYAEGSGAHVLGNLVGRGMAPPVVCDEEALIIDGVLAALVSKRPQVGEAVIVYYLSGRNYLAVERRLGIGRKRVAGMVGEGVAWVDGKLGECQGLARVRQVFGCFRGDVAAPVVDVVSAELAAWFARKAG